MKIFHPESISWLNFHQIFYSVCLFTFVVFFLPACNSSESQVVTGAETSNSAVRDSQENSTAGLTQNADYSQLFNPNLKNCEFLTVSELATAIGVQEKQVATKDNGYYCDYIYTNDQGLLTRFQMKNDKVGKKNIEKEIKGFLQDAKDLGEDSRLLEVRKSETGDTYLMMNQDRNVRLLNPNYEIITSIGYTPVFDAKEKDVDFIRTTKDEMRNKAFSIANALLKKYKK